MIFCTKDFAQFYIANLIKTKNPISLMKKIKILLALTLFVAMACEKQNAVPRQSKQSSKNARTAGINDVELVPIDGTANGHSYKSLMETTFKWAMASPRSNDPFNDPDGSIAQNEQPLNNTTILLGSYTYDLTRNITISQDKYVYFPITMWYNWLFEGPYCYREQIKNPIARNLNFNSGNKYLNGRNDFTLLIDGQPITDDLSRFRSNTGLFAAYIHPEQNNESLDCVSVDNIASCWVDANHLLFKLPLGQHKLVLEGTFTGNKYPFKFTWVVDVI